MEQPRWECVLDAKAGLGEVPLWFADDDALYWIDGYRPSLNRTQFGKTIADTRTREWITPEEIGSFALCADGKRAVVALETGIFSLDLARGATRKLHDAAYDMKQLQFNDGRCDPAGRYWVGTRKRLGATLPDGSGWFYRMDDRGLVPLIDDITAANGIAWSRDGSTMYIADRPKWQITCFDYDVRTGGVSNRRKFADVPVGRIPDGAAVDSEGGYWIAYYRAGLIVRFDRNGKLDRELKAPTMLPTMIAFGGPDLATMFVTTSIRDPMNPEGPLERDAGALFRCNVGARGIPEYRYAFGAG
jgi:sugar lactone lactonase YvrE